MEGPQVAPALPDTLIVRRPYGLVAQQHWRAIGELAQTLGLEVEFGTAERPAEPLPEPEPRYATAEDVLEVVNGVPLTRIMGVKVWRGLITIAVTAHNAGEPPPICFLAHPPAERRWDPVLDRPHFDQLDVASLAIYAASVRSRITGLGRARADAALSQILPEGIGHNSLVMWERIVKKMLAQPEPPAAQ